MSDATIDGIMLQWVFDSETVDIDTCRQEIIRVFMLYTQA